MNDIVERLRYWGADHYGWLLIDEGAAEVCMQAADEIQQLRTQVAALREALSELADLMDAVCEGEYKPDSFTTQPARKALATGEKNDTN